MKGLSFLAAGESFVVDVNLVQKVARKVAITPVPTAPDEVAGIINQKGRVVTVFILDELLGRKEKKQDEQDINAIIFKPLSEADSDGQIGLIIESPGDLIDIDDASIYPPALTTGAEESGCISGIAEKDDRLYRVLDINFIANKYKNNGGKNNV
ncbi:MAG: chemotaxis protein CheW [Oscillospiraceae bacterium]|nr:chemotaxis protein CheW [Oscillospiraceae bacterium]